MPGPVATPLEWVAFVAFMCLWQVRWFGDSSAWMARRDVAFARALDSLPVAPATFGIVWTVLYVLNGVATYSYWDVARASDDSHLAVALAFVFANTLVNRAYAPLFFGARQPRASLVVLVATWVTALVALVLFGIDRVWLAFALFALYVLWLSIAFYLHVRFLSAYAAEVRRAMPPRSLPPAPAVRVPSRASFDHY